MTYLTTIGIKNFRAFNGSFDFNFKPLTILTGTNSSGKSSLTKALLLLKKSISNPQLETLNNPFENFSKLEIDENLNIGNFSYWINNNTALKEETFSFTFPFYFINVLEQYSLELSYCNDGTPRRQGMLCRVAIKNVNTTEPVLVIDDNTFFFDLLHIWKKLEEYEILFTKLESFIDNLSTKLANKIPRLRYNLETPDGDIIPIDDTNEFIIAMLFGHYWGESETGYISPEKFESILSTEEKEEFKQLESNFIILTKILPSEKLPGFTQELTPKIKSEFPLLVYQLKDTSQLKNLKYLQQSDLIALTDILKLDHIPNNTPHNTINTLHFLLQDLATISQDRMQLKQTSQGQDFYVGSNLVKKLGNYYKNHPENHPHELIIEGEVATAYCKSQKYQPNAEIFLKDILFQSFKENMVGIKAQLKNIEFVPAGRNAQPKRNYAANDSTSYFALTLSNLIDFSEYEIPEINRRLKNMLQHLELADDVKIELSPDSTSLNVALINKAGKEINLADFGHGIGQLLPVLMKAAMTPDIILTDEDKTQKRTIIIEEPETGLHPAIQSKLADILADMAINNQVQFIIETHSEYLIRKLQYLTAKGNISPDITKIYYFHHPDNVPFDEKQVKEINIDRDGSLTDDFGSGFFDEADKIALSLWSLNQSRKN